jgi:ABC-type transport system involved in cytochrome c biogenesis permease subunit
MLQRLQSVYLLLAGLCAGATWLFPVRSWSKGDGHVDFLTRGLFNGDGAELVDIALPAPYHILHSVLAGALLVAVFLYANRSRQARVVRGIWIVVLLVAVLQYISCNSIDAYLVEGARSEGSFGISFFLPFAVVLFAILAERAIKKDEALVRSADRLR